ncbi:hydroxymethylglutaryl-CoA lyase [Candidatus Leptofilum sp.]|uniref:hydroxymethylglutaryl-CoA lyase n=1 Tax=Candidatus Leptofilum sp. TaxID=3241576 RepID=UPI003B5AD562
MSIDHTEFKKALSQFATGVTVVTTVHNGTPIGITASSFSSLSLEPPLVLVSLSKKLFTHNVIADSGSFAVNILGATQRELGMRFAGMIPGVEDRFAGVAVGTAVTGCPILTQAIAWLDCRVWEMYDGGDHTIFVGEVVDVASSDKDTPLLYHSRLWRRSEALDEPTLPPSATIIEVGPRDGIQTREKIVPTAMKVKLIRQLAEAGLKRIQVTSFVHPKLVPQMADAAEVCAQLPQLDGVQYNALVLNMKGLERAHAAGIRHVDMGVPASETLSLKNANCSIEEGMERMAAMVQQARAWGMGVRAGVQTAFGCVYEGNIEQAKVVGLCRRFLAMGIDELTLADSAGLGNPNQIRSTIQELLPLAGEVPIVMHLHDTRGMGLANCLSALKSGVRLFDTSFGGLGGCPFIKGAKGNIPTEDTVNMMHEMGVETAVNIPKLAAISREFEAFFGEELPGKIYQLES